MDKLIIAQIYCKKNIAQIYGKYKSTAQNLNLVSKPLPSQ